jgi:anaerobic selenocysteine-containing dehydrogenase
MEPCLPGRLFTRDKTIKLFPGLYLKEIERLLRDMASEDDEAAEYRFKLINRRDMRTNNSWMHNCKKLMKGKNRCTAMIHPEDARTLDIEDGRMVRVSSRVGSIELPAEISDDIMPGVVCIPHGWGHDRPGIRMRTAQENPGVSVNDITDDQLIDTCAGVAVFNGVPVNISRVD